MRAVTPADYAACAGSGEQLELVASEVLRLAICHVCGRKTGFRAPSRKLTRHAAAK